MGCIAKLFALFCLHAQVSSLRRTILLFPSAKDDVVGVRCRAHRLRAFPIQTVSPRAFTRRA